MAFVAGLVVGGIVIGVTVYVLVVREIMKGFMN